MTTRKKITPYGPAWEKLADNLARSIVPPVYPCGECDYPVITGYCCAFCGSQNPQEYRAKKAEPGEVSDE